MTSFHNLNNGRNVLTLEAVRQFAPSVFAAEKHDSRSAKYAYIPTVAPLQALMNEGFLPTRVMQSRTRVEGKQDFTKHMIRLRRREDIERAAVVGETVNEIIMINSHDGTSAYKMMAGVFRFVCANGMVVGETATDLRVPHRGSESELSGKIIDAAYEVIGYTDKVNESKERMQSVLLPPPVKMAMAEAALTIKYGEKEPPIDPNTALKLRRYEDQGDDLWRVFNRLQENIVNGGLRPNGRGARRTRPITGIDEQTRVNKALWNLAESIAEALA